MANIVRPPGPQEMFQTSEKDQKFLDSHREALDLMQAGITGPAIAAQLGVHIHTVYDWRGRFIAMGLIDPVTPEQPQRRRNSGAATKPKPSVVPEQIYFKGCGKCGGDMRLRSDEFGPYLACCQCGTHQDPRNPKTPVARVRPEAIPGGYWRDGERGKKYAY